MIASFNKPIDEEFAAQQLQKLLGKHLLVKITYIGARGDVRPEELIHGTIQDASHDSIKLLLAGTNQTSILPLNAKTLEMSKFRDYELTGLGKKITGVDFTMNLTMQKA